MSDDGAGGETYDDTHRAFLQAFFARQALTLDQAKPILAAIQTAQTPDRPTQPGDITEEDFENYIDSLNVAISPFDFEIRSILHQITRAKVYALVNTTSDALTQMSTIHTPDEIAFVKRVLDAMFETYNNTQRAEVMAVTSIQALKYARPSAEERRRDSGNQTQTAASANTGLTMTQAEKVLNQMVDEGWFELSQKGFYALSPRALMELRGWLEEMYNDQAADDEEDEEEEQHVKIKTCQACKEIVTMGQRCPDLGCPVRVHNNCVRNLFRVHGNREECPTCKTPWVDAPPVGEKAAKHGARRTTNGSSGGARRRTSAMTNGTAGEESDAGSGAEED